ncbi:RL1D1 protein, partial [Origma solitaria]|nr:RL1D1 protein [Origma solitaria]
QVKKAVEALLAFARSKAKGDALLLNEGESVHLLVTVWKVPRVAKVIRIPLPHGIRPDTAEVCLFTKDEPNLSAEQTENLYKKLLIRNGIRSISQIISYKTLKKEYKMFEAKRRLLNRFDLFLSDDRIRRLLPSHLGKHFYEKKKAPLSVNLKAKNLAKELEKHIQGTTLPVNNKGCCYTTRIGHTGMKVDEILENIIAAAKVIDDKLPKKWKNVKILHLKTLKSVALPIFTANISNLDELDKQPSLKKNEEKIKEKKVKQTAKKLNSSPVTVTKESKAAAGTQDPVIKEKVEIVQEPGDLDDEEIPQLVPIKMSSADPKKMEPNLKKGDNLGKKTKTALRKRKKQSLVAETPKSKPEVTEECADLQASPKAKKAKQVSKPKEAIKEKDMKKTPKKPEAKSFATPKAGKSGKSTQSARKPSKPLKQARKKVHVPQSV